MAETSPLMRTGGKRPEHTKREEGGSSTLAEYRMRICYGCESHNLVAIQMRFMESYRRWSSIWSCLDCGRHHFGTKESPKAPWAEGYVLEDLADLRKTLEAERKTVERLLKRIASQDTYIEKMLLASTIEPPTDPAQTSLDDHPLNPPFMGEKSLNWRELE